MNNRESPRTPKTEEKTCSLGSVFSVFGLTPQKKNDESLVQGDLKH